MPTVREVIERLKRYNKLGDPVAVAIWCEEDVFQRAKERGVLMGRKPAAAILDDIHRHHDATIGITWDTFDYYIDEFKREHPHYRRYTAEEDED